MIDRARLEEICREAGQMALRQWPGAGHALARAPLTPQRLPHALKLSGHPLVISNDVIERIGNLAHHADPVARQTHREVTDLHCLQRREQLSQLDEFHHLAGPHACRQKRIMSPVRRAAVCLRRGVNRHPSFLVTHVRGVTDMQTFTSRSREGRIAVNHAASSPKRSSVHSHPY